MKGNLNKFKNIISIILATSLVAQLISAFSSFIINNNFTNESALPVFRFFEAFGAIFYTNWLPFSIMFCIVFVAGIFKSQIYAKKENTNYLMNFVLTCLNLLMCNQLYNTSVFHERIKYYGKNIWGVIGFIILLSILPLIGRVIYNINDSRKNYIEYEQRKPESENNQNRKDHPNNPPSDRFEDDEFMIRHPIIYRWELHKFYNARYHKEKAKVETDKKTENIQNGNLSENYNSIFGVIAIISVAVIDILFFVWVILHSNDDNPQNFINETLSKVVNYLISSTLFLDEVEDHSLNWLSVFGNAFFLLVIFILCNFFIYFAIRAILYFLFHPSEDSKIVKRFSLQLKAFFAGALDDAMRLLLFLPDFLEVIEDFLLDTDIDEMVGKRFNDYPTLDPPDSLQSITNSPNSQSQISHEDDEESEES